MKITNKKIVLFYPHLSKAAKDAARKQMDTRWIGQGPLVDKFELEFEKQISHNHKAIAVNSCTSALHLAYILAGIKDGDEVIGPVFSCSASYAGLLYQRARVVFADINKDNLNLNPDHVEKLLKVRKERVKAIVVVHYGGYLVDMDKIHTIARKWNIPVIEDAAQAIGATYKGKNVGEISQYTAYSFQAIKSLTTGDGGMLTIEDPILEEKAKRIRWFGIDRKAKFEERWKKDIFEVGYKYQMTDIEAAMGLGGLKDLSNVINHSKKLFEAYVKGLEGIPGIRVMNKNVLTKTDGTNPTYWLCTIEVDNKEALKKKLVEHNIESNETHFRCDRYSIYGGRVYDCPNMDFLENRYLLLPMHWYVTLEDVDRVCKVIKSGW
ncbi:MAG: UDP-4-keto-6-deoxy-N-acetylglucosamine 4-aminotransferase [uncultured bacterium]|uniref:DegT/DnrJ/EryC1/StrS aminotransferase n=1 Tax=Candidatus Woesebacteria bacterium GW2011_GWA1_40_43 TaxID=1618553 RepID=A0A0G0UY42_9BACT|nr:MAG: UDP-4-keto-6-deoxy-N-acetylglucosamine 4-aminotransferase [uncultured bacterium]KKR52873.1 MAG: DegT/DnrJ/EryC1/StrS aminotransferase [Candidatus Woesebacteria bacterium GW2011_GWD2_40_19]KKR58376.1 MAG: DegT/DnrJ/EryC1/StrS aminotransferase [Candidatus Woesebacteria bacterium GW2011_GWC2_40_30]KKR64600.1 MAG: DegT/DnrJ/EryC1/StrS aminotransferase [Candidatus Woesebacteria bacterium GW2011_GWA1_40_43]HAU65402.1 DegT/DnrJ/EryC1/StrS aminotransferase [Candidatus Woesebacteria bacterium]